MSSAIKLVLIAVAVLIGWKLLNGAIAGIGSVGSANSSSGGQVPQLGPYYWGPSYYVQGVYGPMPVSGSGPFWSSPYGPPGPLRPRPATMWGN